MPAGEKFSSVLTQLAGGGHVPIEGLAGDVELVADDDTDTTEITSDQEEQHPQATS